MTDLLRGIKRTKGNFMATKETTAALVQAGNGFPVTKWAQPSQLDDEQLAMLVSDGAVKLAVFSEALKPYYLELRERFHKKSEEALIHGCKTWNEYCENVLARTRRAINYWLAGGNPSEKRNSQKNGTKEQGTGKAPAPESGKPPFAITHSPIDGDAAWSKQDASRQILAWSVSCLKNFSTTEKREIAEDVTAKLRDEIAFEAPQPPPIVGDPVPEPEPGTLEALRQRLSRMADTEEMSKALAKFVTDLLTPVLANHPYSPSHRVSVAISRKDKHRVDVGDWVEFVGGCSERLLKLIGDGKLGLGRVVGADELHRRPKVRWHDGGEWKKPYSLFANDGRVHVLYDWQAAERYPEAFSSYPRKQPAIAAPVVMGQSSSSPNPNEKPTA
jgi:phenylpyruvate tautomerase PptA (4-oxalocrotonate tautomerase family)